MTTFPKARSGQNPHPPTRGCGKALIHTNHLRQLSLLVCEFQLLTGGPAADDEGQYVVWRDHVTW
jgi:hypothetical protein